MRSLASAFIVSVIKTFGEWAADVLMDRDGSRLPVRERTPGYRILNNDQGVRSLESFLERPLVFRLYSL